MPATSSESIKMNRQLDRFCEDVYFLEQELKANTRAFYRSKIKRFEGFLGRTASIEDLNSITINKLILHRLIDRSRETVRGERSTLLSLWKRAYDIRELNEPPGRVRGIKKQLAPVVGWEPADLRNLIAAAKQLIGKFQNRDVLRADYWIAVITVLYETGIRVGDLFAMPSAPLVAERPFTILQNKTGKPIDIELSPAGWEAVRAINPKDRKRPFGDVLNPRNFKKSFALICGRAGLAGRTKMIRKLSGSLVERDHPGEGHLKLGNTRPVFEQYYSIRSITRLPNRLPPDIGAG
jgi:site-specific recombinase XerD